MLTIIKIIFKKETTIFGSNQIKNRKGNEKGEAIIKKNNQRIIIKIQETIIMKGNCLQVHDSITQHWLLDNPNKKMDCVKLEINLRVCLCWCVVGFHDTRE